MSPSADDIAALHRRARQFTEVAFALAALAALAIAGLVHHVELAGVLTDEARDVIAWSFVGLAALDALLLLIWQSLVQFIIARA